MFEGDEHMTNSLFIAFLNEAQFTREILGAGATQIGNANYAARGVYYQAFTSLSTGLERIGKICIILDYYIANEGCFPSFDYLKNSIGHDIISIYRRSLEIIAQHSYRFSFLPNLDGEIHQSILNILSDFAKGDRYSNINLIVGSRQHNDPIAKWYEQVDEKLYAKHITQKKKNAISQRAKLVDHLLRDVALVRHISETGSSINNPEDASFRTGKQEAIARYRQLYVIQIIRFWIELLKALQYDAMSQNMSNIPYFSEIFAPFANDDSYIKTRKTWDKI
jgi:hypothetical protein